MGKIEKMNSLTDWERELALLENKSNLRKLPVIRHLGREVEVNGKVMLNLSSNDYLGLAAYLPLRTEFLQSLTPDTFLPSSSSSRLLTGNFNIYVQIEDLLARLFRKESALVFNSGYHMNAGILPAVSDARTLILADKLVHASIIDGIRLSAAKCIRYRHNRYDQLEQLLVSNHAGYDRIIIVTESIFSMDGDEADLRRLVTLKQQYDNVLLYVDEAHAVGVRGMHGLGCAEEQDCVADIDFLCGTFGKALASVGGHLRSNNKKSVLFIRTKNYKSSYRLLTPETKTCILKSIPQGIKHHEIGEQHYEEVFSSASGPRYDAGPGGLRRQRQHPCQQRRQQRQQRQCL